VESSVWWWIADQRQLYFPFDDNYFSRCLTDNVTQKCKPKAGVSGFGLPALSFMRGRPNPPQFYETNFLPAEACWRQGSDNDKYYC
jgi:hypothetical protein